MFPGLGVADYASFGPELQLLAPLERINVLIGPNNSGKSTTLSIFALHLGGIWQAVYNTGNYDVSSRYRRRVDGEPPVAPKFAWPVDPSRIQLDNKSTDLQSMLTFFSRDDLSGWPVFQMGAADIGAGFDLAESYLDGLFSIIPRERWRDLSLELVNNSGNTPEEALSQVFRVVREQLLVPTPPENPLLIPAHRHITKTNPDGTMSETWDPGGSGMILKLHNLRNHEPDDLVSRSLLRRIIEAVREVLELRSFDFHVTSPNQNFALEIDGEPRNLDSLGTGLEHIFLLVAMTVLYPNSLLCVEEPEVHMHPRLQRRLARYLNESTENQFLISTHSATLIDSLSARTFGIRLAGASTVISRPVSSEVIEIFDDLGYRASDLLQSNCAIWVEGPSDRIYLNTWLEALSLEYVEGRDYVVMFYGGALLSHLTVRVDVERESQLVPLHLLNQHFVIIADSDKTSHDAPLKDRVERLRTEVDGNPNGVMWITAGRTIENYVEYEAMDAAIKVVHPSASVVTRPRDQWDSALAAFRAGGEAVVVDKVKVARQAMSDRPSLDRLDLADWIGTVAQLIGQANR